MGVDIVAKCLGKTTKEEILEGLRRQLVGCMRSGQTLVVDIAKVSPDFSDPDQYCTKDESIWAADMIFDQKEWCQKSNYIKVVRESENHRLGGLHHGEYEMLPDFNLLILSTGTKETLEELEGTLPCWDKFRKFKVVE